MATFSQSISAVFVLVVALFTANLADAADRGPKVGTTIPHSLSTQDQHNAPQSFKSLKGRRGLILLFTRSFDW